MKKIRAYILHSSKLIKRGQPGYDPHQEQAKEDVIFDAHIGQECLVEIKDEPLRKEILTLCGVDDADWSRALCLSVEVFDTGKATVTVYYLTPSNIAKHFTVSTYVSSQSRYELAQKVIDLLLNAEQH
jgi:hypothetical protein